MAATMSLHLSFHLPGLLTAAPEGDALHPISQLRLPVLNTWLARADVREVPAPLTALTGLARLPIGRLGAMAAGLSDKRHWLRADPVDLSADHRGIYLLGRESLNLSESEARELTQALNGLLAEDDMRLVAVSPHAWYLELPCAPELSTTPLTEVLGRDVARFQPDGPERARWQRWLTEVSMLLHTAGVNEARRAARRAPVAGLWLWGEGSLPEPARAAAEAVYSDEPALVAYAGLAGIHGGVLPTGYVDLDGGEGRCALYSERLLLAERHGDVASWLKNVETWYRDWFEPAMDALAGGRLASLELLPGNGRAYRLTRGGLRRFWRRRHDLGRYLLQT